MAGGGKAAIEFLLRIGAPHWPLALPLATGGGKTAGIGKGARGLAHSAGIRRPTTRAASQAAQGVLEGMRRP